MMPPTQDNAAHEAGEAAANLGTSIVKRAKEGGPQRLLLLEGRQGQRMTASDRSSIYAPNSRTICRKVSGE